VLEKEGDKIWEGGFKYIDVRSTTSGNLRRGEAMLMQGHREALMHARVQFKVCALMYECRGQKYREHSGQSLKLAYVTL
jgi:hypothetical protein